MAGILAWGAHVPHRRLDRSTIAAVAGKGGGKGTRSVASYDEDTTTMAVEAGRQALATGADVGGLTSVVLSTVEPAYLDKANATIAHAALRLPRTVVAYDAVGSVRSAVGAMRTALSGRGSTLVLATDMRTGLPGSADEAAGGDAAAALLLTGDDHPDVAAELVGWASVTEEFLDRWRTPGHVASKVWEERFGEICYVDLALEAWADALEAAGLSADDVAHLVVAGTHGRAVGALKKKLGLAPERVVDDLTATVGMVGAAQPALLLAAALERAEAGDLIALVVLADGADVALFRATEHAAARRPAATVAGHATAGAPVAYGTFLAWRGVLPLDPPRRPEPARPSAPAASRSLDWKFGFVGSEGADGTIHLPPQLLDETAHPMADATGTVVTFTIDRLAYSPSPPVVFAVVDFDGGGRLPVELTDVAVDEVRIGLRVEMSFRRLFTSDGVHNYFWKARPARHAGVGADAETGPAGTEGS